MDQHQDNPPLNQLPADVEERKLLDAVRKSGYPLQTLVARTLSSRFQVIEEWGYLDRAEKRHRSLDVYAFRELETKTDTIRPRLHLLVECKRSSLPYVFFAPGVDRAPLGFPEILGTGSFHVGVEKGTREATPALFFCATELGFVSPGPAIATAFTKAEWKKKPDGLELSGEVPFNQVVMPLASAMEQLRNVIGRNSFGRPVIALALCVMDATMVVASGTPEEPELRNEPWTRVVHQEVVQEGHFWRARHYTVDFVHRAFLSKYIDDHALPFAEALAARIGRCPPASGKAVARVRAHDSTWEQYMKHGK